MMTFGSVDRIIKCDHSNESYFKNSTFCGAVSNLFGGSNMFGVCLWM